MDGEGTQDTGYAGNGEGQQGHPAWDEFLAVVPQELHPQVTPILEKWDKGVEERFQKVHSEYEPWKPIIKAASPSDTEFALNLLNQLQDDPEKVYNAIKQYYKFGDNNGSPSGQGQDEPKDEEDPYAGKFSELERQNQIMAKALLNKYEEDAQAKAEAELDQELSALRKKYGEYDERYVLAMMQNGASSEDAVKGYFTWRDQELKRHVPKPLIMGSGGGLPNQTTDVTKLSDKDTKGLVAQMLEHHARQNQ